MATPGAESGAVVMVKPESNSGALIPGATANSRPTFSTDGGASAPVSGFWARIYHNGTRWSYIEYANGSGGSAFSTVAMAGAEATPLEATWQSGYSVSAWVTPPQNVLASPGAGGAPSAPLAILATPGAAGAPSSPSPVLGSGTVGEYPATLRFDNFWEGPPDATWMNGNYQAADDYNGYPSWERVVGNLRAVVHSADPEAPWYDILVYTRVSAEAAWTEAGTMFVPNMPGYPWDVSWIEDGSYPGDPVCFIESYVTPPASVLP